ncbi:MAG: DUF3098 domain-containing protein [Bacteroidetes bacterium]|nr:DUF3098 domain-containing protein [Bacteroidota bacterium]
MSEKMPFGPRNYKLMVAGLLIIITGFTLMSLDSDPHGFGFLGLTLGPIVTVAGFLFELYAILANPGNTKK